MKTLKELLLRLFIKMTGINGKFREYKLKNGLYVALQETPTETIAGRLRVNYAALHEKKGEEGLAHFLEHALIMGGTKRYSPREVDDIWGNLGNINAFTGMDRTCIPVDMLADDLEQYLAFASETFFNPRFDSQRLNEQRQRVLREIADTKSNPLFRDNQDYLRTLLGDHPSNHFILGKEQVIENSSQDDLRKFHSKGYNANNMDLILVGRLPPNVDYLIEKYFSDQPTGGNTKFQFPHAKDLEQRTILHRTAPDRYNADSPQESSALMTIGFLVPPESSDDFAALQVLSYLLGGDSSSRLFQSISQRKGLAYGIHAEYDGSYGKGIVCIQAEVPSIKQHDAIEAIFYEMEKLKSEPVRSAELDRIRKTAKYSIAKHFESNHGHVDAIETKNDTGRTPESSMANLNKLTPEKIREVAQRYLPSTNGNYVLLIRDPLKM